MKHIPMSTTLRRAQLEVLGNRPERQRQSQLTWKIRRYNSGDVDAVMALMAPDVAYHDLALYQEPFRGADAVRAYFEKASSFLGVQHHLHNSTLPGPFLIPCHVSSFWAT